MRRILLGLVLALVLAPSAAAGPGLLVGVDDDTVKWAVHTQQVVAVDRALGVAAIRVTLAWAPGETSVADPTLRLYLRRFSQAAQLGERVVLSVYGPADAPPLTPADRADFCDYALDALERAPGVNDVVVWNEANSPLFWRHPDPAAYEALLAQCWDTLHARLPGVNVISSTAPHQHPARFIARLGAAYRASGRTRPLFDTFGHNAYPNRDGETPATVHGADSAALDEGDYLRLVAALQAAFGYTPPIWYLEDGFQTQTPANELAYYNGRESDRGALPAGDQGAELAEAIELASCQPAVTAFFNFELADDPTLSGWQSGVLWASWTPKPSYAAVQAAIAAVAAGRVDCSQFGAAA